MKELDEIEARAEDITPFEPPYEFRIWDKEFYIHARTDVPRLVKALRYVSGFQKKSVQDKIQSILRGE